MKLTILSDIHDNVWNLQKVLNDPNVQKTGALLCCGDLCAPFIVKLLGQQYAKPIHIVLGNNDGDVASFIRVAANFPNIHLHGEYFRGEFGGRTLAMNHYPDKARLLAESGQYHIVCYGHDHQLNWGGPPSHEASAGKGKTLLLNPGAVMGYNGAALKDIPATYVVLDTEALEVEVFVLCRDGTASAQAIALQQVYESILDVQALCRVLYKLNTPLAS